MDSSHFSTLINDFKPGIFGALNEKKEELLREGRKVYNLSVGTPDFRPAPHVMKAMQDACGNPENYKYSLADLPELLEAVCYRYEKRFGVHISTDEVMSVYGSQEGITHVGFTLCDKGDVVLVPDPGYPIFGIGPSLAGAVLETYPLTEENGYVPDLEALSKAADRAKFMIVSYPMNPICKCAPEGFYERLVRWAAEHNLVLIHDNAYSDIIFDGRRGGSILAVPGAKEVCVEFFSLSKTYNYTGARMSFLVGNREIIAGFKKLRSQIDYGTFLPVQYGAIAALNGPEEPILRQCEEYQRRRDALCGGLRAAGWNVPDSEGTMFAWARIPEGFTDDVDFVMKLMEATGVLCTPGSSFGTLGKGHVRFALTLPVPVIGEAVEAVRKSGILF